MVTDTFEVSMRLQSRQAESAVISELHSQLQLLGATRMRPGDTCFVTATDGTSRLDLCERARPLAPTPPGSEGRLSRYMPPDGLDAEPTVVLVDAALFGATLALAKGEVAKMWRDFLWCHAPSLLPKTLGNIVDARDALRQAAAERDAISTRSEGSDMPAPHEVGRMWHSTMCKFLLYRIRLEAGEGELGMQFYELEMGSKLGEGAFGLVRLARHRVSGVLFAVKSIEKARIRRIGEERTFELLERERRILMTLGSTKVRTGLTRLVSSAHDAETLRIVMPAYLGGDLSHLIEANEDARGVAEPAAQFYAGCLVLSLSKLHEMGVVYRDLKPENVLLSANGWPVLCDFGLVAFLGDGASQSGGPSQAKLLAIDDDAIQHTYSMAGTPEFMAPEIVAGTGHDTDADWWSLGVLIAEMTTLCTPFLDHDNPEGDASQMYANILQGKYVGSFKKERRRLNPRTATFIDDLLKVDCAMRLGGRRRGVESMRVHAFFWGLAWDALEQQQLIPPHEDYCEQGARDKRGPSQKYTVTPMRSHKRKDATDAATAALDRLFDFSGWGEEI